MLSVILIITVVKISNYLCSKNSLSFRATLSVTSPD
jgi:hypothetical protein